MIKKAVITVIKRELKEKMMSKSFIIMTLLFPLLMFGLIGIQILLNRVEGPATIEIVTNKTQLTQDIETEFEKSSLDYNLQFLTIEESQFSDWLLERKELILSQDITGILYIPPSALEDKEIEYYSSSAKNLNMSMALGNVIDNILIDYYFANRDISEEDIAFSRKEVSFKDLKIAEDSEITEQGYGDLIVAYIFSFLLYMSLLMSGSTTMSSVIEEKSNRIVEMILSSISAKDFMMSKILGASLTSLAQMFIWLSPIFIISSSTVMFLPPEFMVELSPGYFVFFLFNFFLGLLLFIGLFATVGSIFETAQDAQSGMWPIMLLIIIPFFIGISMVNNPSNPIGAIASFVPLASIIVMPVRMSVGDVQFWEVLIASALNIGALFFIFPAAGKIYQIGIFKTGKKPSFKDVVQWLKVK